MHPYKQYEQYEIPIDLPIGDSSSGQPTTIIISALIVIITNGRTINKTNS